MTKKHKHKQNKTVPVAVQSGKAEEERKYRVNGESWDDRVALLRQIFKFVAADKRHFATFDAAPHTEGYDARLLAVAKKPKHTKALRERFYWDTTALDGRGPANEGLVEIRTENKLGKHFWEQVVKLGGSGTKTLKRDELPCSLDGPGVNMNVYEEPVRKAVHKVIGDKTLYPMLRIQSQSEPVLYHPDGRADVTFEIKFDVGVCTAFDGYEEDIVEIEIEVKDAPKSMSVKEIEELFDKSELKLFSKYADDLSLIFESKAAACFQHLVGWRERDKKEFKDAVKASAFNVK